MRKKELATSPSSRSAAQPARMKVNRASKNFRSLTLVPSAAPAPGERSELRGQSTTIAKFRLRVLSSPCFPPVICFWRNHLSA